MTTQTSIDLSYLKESIIKANSIAQPLYEKFEVKRGLRNKDGSGVLAGLTNISSVRGFIKIEREMNPIEGELKYRGIEIQDLMASFNIDSRYCFEEVCYLLLVGNRPSAKELSDFSAYMAAHRQVPHVIIDNVITGLPSKNIMNKLQGAVSALYGFDDDADSNDPYENFLKSVQLLAKLPMIVAYGYLSAHKENPKFVLPDNSMSHAESLLYMLYEGKTPSKFDAHIMDVALVLHAEHGGGNNSTFTTYVVSSSGSDIYSTMAAAIASLKGPLHGSANKKVMDMMADIKANVKDWGDVSQVDAYLTKIINQEAHDKSGKVYGLGHAVYTLSDPRATVIKKLAVELAKEKNREAELNLYFTIEKEGPGLFQSVKGSDKVIAPNVDFFSGFVYDCLDIPEEIYTPMFAMARTCGWCAHRIEESLSSKRIIRPGYKFVDIK